MTITVTNIENGPFVATGDAQSVSYNFMTLTASEGRVWYDGGDGQRVFIPSEKVKIFPNKSVTGEAVEGGDVLIEAGAIPSGANFYFIASPRRDRDVRWSNGGSLLINLNDENDRITVRQLLVEHENDRVIGGYDGIFVYVEEAKEAADRAGSAAEAVEAKMDRVANLSDVADPLAARNNLLVSEYPTRSLAIGQNILPDVAYIRTSGYASVGDDGGSLYKRASSEPSHDAKFQTADGAWWEMASKDVRVEQFGAKGDGVTDDSLPIAQAVGFADVVRFGVKTYVGSILLWRSCKLVGDGANHTTIRDDRATGDTVRITASPYLLEGLHITRSTSITPTSGAGINTPPDGYGVIRDILSSQHWTGVILNSTANSIFESSRVQFNYSSGIEMVTSTVMEACQWKMTNLISQLNNGWGYSAYAVSHVNGPIHTGPVMVNCGSYANGEGGFVWSGDSNTAWNDVNGVHCYSSFDNGHGMLWFNLGGNNQFHDTFVEFTGTHAGGRAQQIPARGSSNGVTVVGGRADTGSIIYNGLVIMIASASGFNCVAEVSSIQLSNVLSRDNGLNTAVGNKAGIELNTVNTRYVINNVVSQAIEVSKTQQYGIHASAGAAAKTSVIGGLMNGNLTAVSSPATSSFAAWLGVLV